MAPHPDVPAFGVGAAFLMIAVGQALGSPLVGSLVDYAGAPTAFLAAAATAALGTALRPARAPVAADRVPVECGV